MKKYLIIIAALFVISSVQVSSVSYLYTFSSGDILDPNAYAYYGVGRIDFVGEYNIPVPTVIQSGDRRSLGLGSFTRNGQEYIYLTKSLKYGASTTHLVTDYAFYDPSISVSIPLNSPDRTLRLPYNTVASSDILLPPDEANGLIYAIDGNTLIARDPLTWNNQASVQLDSGYDVHSLVSLWPDTHNYLYVWSSKRTNITASGDYTPISSDIHVYDRETLNELAVFRHVRTGFDTTMKKSDDEPTLEMGRGLVFIGEGLIAYVAYDEATSRDAHASIWCIDETGSVPVSTRTISSSDIDGFDVDIESPMPDSLGGFYFVAESGDLNASLSSTDISAMVYHYTSDKRLFATPSINVTSNGELVITEGVHKGGIFMFSIITMASHDNNVEVFFWDGEKGTDSIDWGNHQTNLILYEVGVEIEKPFPVGNGFYYSMESKNESIRDEKDSVFYWDGVFGSRSQLVWSSDNELEVEQPPLDGVGGFYFVNVDMTSPDANTLISTMTLMHGTPTGSSVVCDLGSFKAPPSTFLPNPKDPQAIPEEAFQNEFALFEETEHNQLFAGAGPVGGKFRLTVLDWTNKANLTSNDIIITYDDEDMGGNANIGGMIQFTEGSPYHGIGSSSGCDSGLGFMVLAGVVLFVAQKKKF
ncbi:MAG: hypothetical protein II869_00550 [Synergistaceae bacterium]|nr:hypothetical protein [Synergistaceae bacterium]